MAAVSIMAISAIGEGITNSYLAEAQGIAARSQANVQVAEAEINKRFAEIQAKDMIERGSKEAIEHQKKVNQTVGAQRAAAAASGVVVDDGSSLEIQTETAEIGALDVNTIKSNAYRQAFGFKQQALGYEFQARSAKLSGKYAMETAGRSANMSLATGGMNAINYGMQGAYKKGWMQEGGE